MIARIKEECVEEFAEILKNVKDTGREYKNFVAGTIAVCAWLIAWKKIEFSVMFNIRGDGAERRVEEFIEKVVIPLKEKYPYAEVCIRVNG